MASSWILSILTSLFLITAASSGGYVKDQIGVKMATVHSICIRFLNGTQSVGCQSNLKGNVGALVQIAAQKDVQEAVDKLPLGIANLIALVDLNDLNSDLIESMRTNDRVQGIILLDYGERRPQHFSEDAACPNQHFSFYKSAPTCHPWNSPAAIHQQGLKFLEFDKPIRFVDNRTEIDLLVQKCAIPFNRELQADGFRCVARMTAFMPAAGNAEICMRRQEMGYGFTGSRALCDPLSDRNVFAMLPPLSQKNTSVRADQFVLAARMDAFSTNLDSRAGDLSVLTSIVSLLSVAHAIGTKMDVFMAQAKRRQLLFAFFHGESMGYIGSSRWLWDAAEDRFPHPPSKLPDENVRQTGVDALSFFLELQQIGTGDKLFLHTDQAVYAANGTLLDQVIKSAGANPPQFIDPSKLPYGALPPSSYHSVLKVSQTVPGMVLSSFGPGQYKNNYLNSIFDTQFRRDSNDTMVFDEYVERMRAAAEVSLNAALAYVFNTNDSRLIGQFSVDKEYVETLANCFFRHPNWDCRLILDVVNATNDPSKRRWLQYTANHLYIGTDQYYHESAIRKVIFSLLVNSLGQKGPAMNAASAQQCWDQNKKQNVYTFVWQNDPTTETAKCYRTSIYLGTAKSPAFEIEGYDFANANYSTWMEAVESGGSLELYLMADYRLELYALLAAIVVILVSAPLNYGLKEQWFIDNTLPPASPQQL